MSLKQKNERAFKAVVSTAIGGDSPIRLVTSQENQTVTRGRQLVSFIDQGGPERPIKSRTYDHQVLALVKTSFDKQPGAATNPEDTHAGNVLALKNALTVSNLASLLSAAQTDYHVLFVEDLGEAEVDPDRKGRAFVDGFLYRVIALENDCT